MAAFMLKLQYSYTSFQGREEGTKLYYRECACHRQQLLAQPQKIPLSVGLMLQMSQLLLDINLNETYFWLGHCFPQPSHPSKQPTFPSLWSTNFQSKKSILGQILGKQEHTSPIPVSAGQWGDVRRVYSAVAMFGVAPLKASISRMIHLLVMVGPLSVGPSGKSLGYLGYTLERDSLVSLSPSYFASQL